MEKFSLYMDQDCLIAKAVSQFKPEIGRMFIFPAYLLYSLSILWK